MVLTAIPGFLFYCLCVAIFALVMIYRIAPRYGKSNPLIYISICSTVGSVSVMAIKAFGIALKLTLGGSNQFTHPSTYVFIIVVVVCILTQMNYFNKALSQFSTSLYILPPSIWPGIIPKLTSISNIESTPSTMLPLPPPLFVHPSSSSAASTPLTQSIQSPFYVVSSSSSPACTSSTTPAPTLTEPD